MAVEETTCLAENGSILVVEDEYPIRRLLNEGLSAEGFNVITAPDAGAALRLLEETKPDIVLIDLMLPGMGGIELARKMYAQCRVTIIAMSASHSLLREARRHPFVKKTISKPFEWDSLVTDLQRSVA